MTTMHSDPAWRVIRERSAFFNDADYGRFVSNYSFEYYRKRVINVGFSAMQKVLDVGCGHGHWTCALASLNNEVIGIDIHSHRVQIAAELIRDLWIDNASTKIGDALKIPFGDAEFDGLFCYGVFMFLDPKKALEEFFRVLKPGGKLYICTNGPGWWLRLAMKSLVTNRPGARVGWHAFRGSRIPGTPSSLTIKDAQTLLHTSGFLNAQVAAEGALKLSDISDADVMPVYPPTFLTLDNVIEVVAYKKGSVSQAASTETLQSFPLLREVYEVLAAPHKDYLQELARYHVADAGELTYASHAPRISFARACSAGVDRTELLAACASIVTKGSSNDEEYISALVNFCQKYFYHHFAVQPIIGTTMVEDPIDMLSIRTGRCGSAARFLVDLLEVSGFEAGLISGACHTAAEVYLEGSWRLLDPSLYADGTLLTSPGGGLLQTSQAISNPDHLDRLPSYINYNNSHIDAFCTAYPLTSSKIERYLRHPILPSTGYFGGEFAGARAGRLLRYRKSKMSGSEWCDWGCLQMTEELQAPVIQTRYRPGQVREVELKGGTLRWSTASTAEPGDSVVYDIYVSRTSRGWDYLRIPNKCSFQVPGEMLRTNEISADISSLLSAGPNYVTIIARRADSVEAFHLPSPEFVIGS